MAPLNSLSGTDFDQFQYPENTQPLGPDIHLAVVIDLYHLRDLHQRTHFIQLVVDDRRNAKGLSFRYDIH